MSAMEQAVRRLREPAAALPGLPELEDFGEAAQAVQDEGVHGTDVTAHAVAERSGRARGKPGDGHSHHQVGAGGEYGKDGGLEGDEHGHSR